MRVLIKIRQIQEQIDRVNSEIRFYLEFEFTDPAEIARVSINSLNTQEKNSYRDLVGKDVYISLEQSEYNGRKFWRLVNGGKPEVVQSVPLKNVASK
jgi:Na+/phosphate symporter